MNGINRRGVRLAELTGYRWKSREGHDLAGPCVACKSTDGFRLHEETGVAFCYSCGEKFSPLAVAEKLLGDRHAAIQALINVGIFEPRGRANGKPAGADPLQLVAMAKGVTRDAMKSYGARADGASRVVFPVFDEQGEQCSTFTIATHEGRGLSTKGRFERGKPAGLFLPVEPDGKSRLPQPGESWFVVEGPKDAAALTALGHLACGLPRNAMSAKFARVFKSVNVLIIPDRDRAGEDGARQTAAALFKVAEAVKLATLPGEFKDSKGLDVRDVLKMRDGERLLQQAIADAAPFLPAIDEPVGGDRERIEVTPDEAAVVAKVIRALGRDPELFRRAGGLAHVVDDAHGKSVLKNHHGPRVAPVDLGHARIRIASVVEFHKVFSTQDGGSEERAVHVPDWVVRGVMAAGEWPEVRELQSVSDCPIFRPDGTVCQARDYDTATGVLVLPSREYPPIPERPSKEDIEQARDALLEPISDFPLPSDSHRAAALAGLFSLVARPAFDGPAPLLVVDSNVRGAGKGLLADVLAIIATGRDAPKIPFPGNDEELSKLITGILLEGHPLAVFDNVVGPLGSAVLDAVLTCERWQSRILGQNKTVMIPALTCWVATGNNITLRADTARRCLHVRIESHDEHPEERTGFRHSDLKAFVRAERPRLLTAALTILRGYYAAGRPDMNLTAWGSYEGWSRVVRGAMVWGGISDPAATRPALMRDADFDAQLLAALLAGLAEVDPRGEGMTTSEILAAVEAGGSETLREALSEMATKGTIPTATQLGVRLRRYRGRVLGGRFIERTLTRTGIARWSVCDHRKSAGDAGDAGDVSNPSRGTTETPVVCVENTRESSGNYPQHPMHPQQSRCCTGDDLQDEQTASGIRVTCRRCGKFYGYRREGVGTQASQQLNFEDQHA